MKLRITVEGRVYDVEVEMVEDADAASVPAPEEEPSVTIPEAVLRARPAFVLPEDKICRSPIAGLITSLIAQAGQAVDKDEPILTIEAMKMESRIGAPVGGVVKIIHVYPGETVKNGQLLFELA